MGQVAVFFLIAIGVFVALEFLVVESWPWRLGLAAIVIGLWLMFGSLAAMIAASVLSVGIIIASKIPKVSKL